MRVRLSFNADPLFSVPHLSRRVTILDVTSHHRLAKNRENHAAWLARMTDAEREAYRTRRRGVELPRYSGAVTAAEKEALRVRNNIAASKWRRTRPDSNRARIENRRARLAGIEGSFTSSEWTDLKAKYRNRCVCCGRKVKWTPDHVVPVSGRHGQCTNHITNIQPLCLPCNSAKNDHHATDYRQNPHPNCLA